MVDMSTVRQRGQAVKEKARLRLTDPSSWQLPKQSSSIAPPDVWTNADQDPVPYELQTWGSWTFIAYWYSDLVTISTWNAGSAILTTGLNATDAILIVLVAGICNAIPTVLNGAIGSELHISFPIAARAGFGYWFSYFCVISRGILALFWFGVQTANGATCITQILIALFPSYATIPNSLPKSAGTTTQGMISFFLYWCVQFPLLLIPTHKLQYMFLVKIIFVTPMALAMVIWICVKAGNQGEFFYAPATVSGSTRAWLWVSSLTSITGSYSTLCVNIPDFSRFSKTKGAQMWQLPFIPFIKTLVGSFGVLSAGAARQIYGKTLWSPLEIIATWQDNPGGRAAAFFCASLWLLAQISVNISANSISFANDITTLAPRYFNIRRGVIFAAVIGSWALCPWIIVSSAATFLNFMSAYAIFMAPIAGILFADYWLIKKRKYDVPALYDPNGIYRYQWGCNWRAFVATFATIVPLLPGLANKVTPQNVKIDQGLVNLFSFNWLYGFFLSISIYWTANYFFPHKPTLIDEVVHGYNAIPVLDGVDGDIESQLSGEKGSSIKDGKIEPGPVSTKEVGPASSA